MNGGNIVVNMDIEHRQSLDIQNYLKFVYLSTLGSGILSSYNLSWNNDLRMFMGDVCMLLMTAD